MNTRPLIRTVSLFVIFCAAVPLAAQRISVTPIIQGAINAPYAGFASFVKAPAVYGSLGIGAGLGLGGGLDVSAEVSPRMVVGIRGTYGAERLVHWTYKQIGWSIVRGSKGNKVYPAYSTYSLDIESSSIDASLWLGMRTSETSPLLYTIGFGMGSVLSASYAQQEVFHVDPVSILNDSRLAQRDTSSGTITSGIMNPMKLLAGLRYEKDLSASSRIVYDVALQIGLTPTFEAGGGWLTQHAVKASVGYMFDLRSRNVAQQAEPEPEPEVVSQPEPIVEVVPPLVQEPVREPEPAPVVEPEPVEEPAEEPEPVLVAEPVREPEPVIAPEPEPMPAAPCTVRTEAMYVVLPYVFFAPGSSTISANDYDIRTAAQGNDPSLNARVVRDGAAYTAVHEALNRQMLNIIGYRMSSVYPSAKLIVDGYINGRTTDSTAPEIGTQRARSVRDYLITKWNIDPLRIIQRSSNSISPTACTYALREAQDILDAEEENSRVELSSPNSPQLFDPVVARETVPCGKAADTIITIYRLISRRSASGVLDTLLGTSIRASLSHADGAIVGVRIVGSTDRKGADAVNMRIAEQRARLASSVLRGVGGAHSIGWIGEGASAMPAPYSNDSAFGRLMNRCAEIVVKRISPQP